MSITKFKPIVWATKFEKDLDKKLVAYDCVNHEYEGLATQPGDSIKILGLGEVETGNWGDGRLHKLPDAQAVQGTSMTMPVNQIEYFRFFVDDLDKRQSVGGGRILSEYMQSARDKVAQAQDSYIFSLVKDADSINSTGTTISKASKTSTVKTLMGLLDDGLLNLLENNVSRDTEMVAITPPEFNIYLKNEYVELDTDNSAMLSNGWVGRYSSLGIKESNNLYKDTEGFYYCPVMTKRAISFVKPYIHLESQRATDYFNDEVKGYALYDGMITRPHEIGYIKIKFTA